MKILAIDSTKNPANISFCIKDKREVFFSPNRASHSESLLVSIEENLLKTGNTVQDIEVFGVVIGPGSFTGIRIGVSIVKAFMYTLGAKGVAVNSFDLIAYNIKEQKGFLVAINADNRGCYVAEYLPGKTLLNTQAMSLEELENKAKNDKLKVYFLESEKDTFKTLTCPNKEVKKNDNALINLVKEKTSKKEFVSINQLEPLYIKYSQAEQQYRQNLLKEITFSIATLEDLEELAELEKDIFSKDFYNKDSLREEITKEDRYFLVAKFKEDIVGYLIAQILPDNTLNILKIATKEALRRQGLASEMLKKLRDKKEDLGYISIFLEVRKDNLAAINFYKKHGFLPTHTRAQYYKDGTDALVLIQ